MFNDEMSRRSSGSKSPSPSPVPSSSGSAPLTPIPLGSTSRSALSLLVILPQQHDHANNAGPSTPPRPSALVSRQSTSRIPRSPTSKGRQRDAGDKEKGTATDDVEAIDEVVDAGRRLSLAPGLGIGSLSQRFSPSPLSPHSRPSTSHISPAPSPTIKVSRADSPDGTPLISPADTSSPFVDSSTPSTPHVFGSKSLFRSRRRPQTAVPSTPLIPSQATQAGGPNRASMAMASGMGIGPINRGAGGKVRPGWEGDEIVGMLRNGGLEVTVVRNPAQISSILSPRPSSPTFTTFNQQTLAARPSIPTLVTPVILVPLCDQPTLPTLSLMLQQGTTPTAALFQRDLLDRAKIAEEAWLPPALDRVRDIVELRDQAVRLNHTSPGRSSTASSTVLDAPLTPVVLAYSANPALPPSVIAACVTAGAAGVLKPPFDLETGRQLRRMVRAAKEGRISSVVGLPSPGINGQQSPSYEEEDPFGRVVLPPTALSMGGEHEGEKALYGAMKHQREMSIGWDSRSSASSLSGPPRREMIVPRRKSSLTRQVVVDMMTSEPPPYPLSHSTSSRSLVSPTSPPPHGGLPSDKASPAESSKTARRISLRRLNLVNAAYEARRRSVDVPGLEMALSRVQKAYELQSGSEIDSDAKSDFSFLSKRSVKRSREDVDLSDLDGQDANHVNPFSYGEGSSMETHLAELLSAMYCQSQLATRIQMDDFASLSAPMSPEHRLKLVDALSSWDFRPHRFHEGDLLRIACLLFEGALLLEDLAVLDIKQVDLYGLLYSIRALYHSPNPYHNYVHAVDVLQAAYSFLAALELVPPFSHLRQPCPGVWPRPSNTPSPNGTKRVWEIVRDQDVLATLIAAIGHDVGHPGFSNAFMSNAKTPLSQVYDNKSVLENMHCMLLAQLLRKHGFGFLLGPDHSPGAKPQSHQGGIDTKSFRKVLYSAILATDMSLHHAWMQGFDAFANRVKDWESPHAESDIGVEGDRVVVAQAIIKSADISNPTRPLEISEFWSTAILSEWAVQSSIETHLELPISVISSADARLQASGQYQFIDLFTQPLFDAIANVWPEMRIFADRCADNRPIWAQRYDRSLSLPEEIVVPAVSADAYANPRLANLFPLSLPTQIAPSISLFPGRPSTPSTPPTQLSALPDSLLKLSNGPKTTKTSPTSTTSSVSTIRNQDTSDPAAKAMRTVYHATATDTRHRLSSWTRGLPVPGVALSHYLETRRSSTPDGILPSQLALGLGR